MVMHSESIFVNYHADCQEAFAYLDKTLIIPKTIYVSVPLTFENNCFKLINPSNLPINFEWQNVNIEDEKFVEFSPLSGTIQPKSSVDISYRMIFYSSKFIYYHFHLIKHLSCFHDKLFQYKNFLYYKISKKFG